MGTGSFVVSNACLISTNIDPTAVRYLVAHGVDRATAMRIVERATDEWQHGNTVITPMRVAMDHVVRTTQAHRHHRTTELERSHTEHN